MNPLIVPDVVDFCAAECERQMSGEKSVAKMFRAYLYAYHTIQVDGVESLREPHMMNALVFELGYIVDSRNARGYRIAPVHFANGGFGANSHSIPRLMNQLFNFHHDFLVTTDEFCKEFLDIHPFIDGNGRTAAILYNVLNDTLENPQTLPDYYNNGMEKFMQESDVR